MIFSELFLSTKELENRKTIRLYDEVRARYQASPAVGIDPEDLVDAVKGMLSAEARESIGKIRYRKTRRKTKRKKKAKKPSTKKAPSTVKAPAAPAPRPASSSPPAPRPGVAVPQPPTQ